MQQKNIARLVAGAVALIILLVVAVSSFGTISAGSVGIKTRFNRVVGTIDPGFYAVVPFVSQVHEIDVQTQKVQQDASAASSDLQDVHTTIAVNYNITPSRAADIYSNIGTDYQDVVIDPAIQEAVKASTANYTAEQLITQREKVRGEIVNALTEKLGALGINVQQVSITNFSFSESFNAAIEAKVTAEQNALASKNLLEQKKYEAEQTVVTAKAQAEAIQIQAQAIQQQGGAGYVNLKAVEKWDGHLPTQMIPGQTLPFLNLTR